MKFLTTLISTAIAATIETEDYHEDFGDDNAPWDPEWYDYDHHEYAGHDHHGHSHSDYHYDHDGHDHIDYAYDGEYVGNVPNGDFYRAVHDYNVWDETFEQADYEWRLD